MSWLSAAWKRNSGAIKKVGGAVLGAAAIAVTGGAALPVVLGAAGAAGVSATVAAARGAPDAVRQAAAQDAEMRRQVAAAETDRTRQAGANMVATVGTGASLGLAQQLSPTGTAVDVGMTIKQYAPYIAGGVVLLVIVFMLSRKG